MLFFTFYAQHFLNWWKTRLNISIVDSIITYFGIKFFFFFNIISIVFLFFRCFCVIHTSFLQSLKYNETFNKLLERNEWNYTHIMTKATTTSMISGLSFSTGKDVKQKPKEKWVKSAERIKVEKLWKLIFRVVQCNEINRNRWEKEKKMKLKNKCARWNFRIPFRWHDSCAFFIWH